MSTRNVKMTLDHVVDGYRRRNPRSAEMSARAAAVMPGGITRSTTFFRPFPPNLVSGSGCMVEDLDGNRRVDFLANYSSLIHGHAHPKVIDAAMHAATKGTAFASPTEYEVRLAELLCTRVASLDKIRFTNSGTEATMAALRLARAFTGRHKILRFAGGYHGTHDYTTTPGAGVPPQVDDLVLTAPYNDADTVATMVGRNPDSIAAVIVEPVLGSGGVIGPRPGFLESLRAITAEHGVLLIFDEVISFRLHQGGAQAMFGVTPDLTTFGKIIGGGFPVGAFGGRNDIMTLLDPETGSISLGGTFNGNPVGAAAGIAALEDLTPGAISRLNDTGDLLSAAVNDTFTTQGIRAQVTSVGSLFNLHATNEPIVDNAAVRRADDQLLSIFHLGLMNRGYFIAPRGMGSISTPMTSVEIEGFVDAIGALSSTVG